MGLRARARARAGSDANHGVEARSRFPAPRRFGESSGVRKGARMDSNSAVRSVHNPDLALLIMRVMLGVIGIFHGSQKVFAAFGGPGPEGFAQALAKMGVPAPTLAAWITGLAELIGGVLVGIGLWT